MEEDVEKLVKIMIEQCHTEVDRELATLRAQIASHTITEAQAEDIATRAAQKAKVLTKDELIRDAKLEIGNASIEILKRASQVIGLFVVGLAFYIGSRKWPWD